MSDKPGYHLLIVISEIMTSIKTIFLGAILLSLVNYQQAAGYNGTSSKKLYLTENKGQVTDQHFAPRNDIQYLLQTPGLTVFIGDGQLHYQFSHTTIHEPDLPGHLMSDYKNNTHTLTAADLSATINAYRMDVELVGANRNAQVTASEPLPYYENYYLPGCPENGAQAHTCGRITYKNIYPDIDWVIYTNGNQLEHEFVVGPHGNPADIQLRYTGQTSLAISNDGSLVATTPMGTIKEQPPVCICKDGNKSRSSYHLDGNVLSYKLDISGELIIDPVLEWGTYYGPDSNNTSQYGIVCDHSGKIYTSGLTYSETSGNIATTGSFQSTYGGGCDAFVVKFDTSGNRIWATYYGGPFADWSNGLDIDGSGGVYMLGTTSSTTGISTSGSQQPAFGGSWDGFVVKFNSAGVRQWGTYLGGSAIDYPQTIACDALGHVYVGGTADSYTNISTAGSFMPTHGGGHDDFMVQYDAMGVRQWGTYIGGSNDDFGGSLSVDGNFVYIAGYTTSPTGITTPSTHQPTISGTTDAFLMRFTNTGLRVWGTYFGGPDPETVGGVCSVNGYAYLFGSTNSDVGIATSGCYQSTRAGGPDAFLAKINPDAGTVMWSTYFGGPGDENLDHSRITNTDIGDVYITGVTPSTSGIASAGSWQTTYGGGTSDGFLAKFSPSGSLFWSTYYGGSGTDEARACAFDGANVYVAGQTASPNNIATPGSFLDTGGSGPFYFQSCIAKFIVTDTAMTVLSAGQQHTVSRGLALYPNPNAGSFTLSGAVAGNGQGHITVTDMAGRTIAEDDVTVVNGQLSKHIDLPSGAACGVYFVKVVTGNSSSVLRFVKEKGQ